MAAFDRYRLLHAACLASLVLAPIAWLQGRRVRREVPEVAPARGPDTGLFPGAGPALRLLVIGESPVAGYGAPTHEQAISGQLAATLGRRTGRAVTWRALGADGVTAERVRRELLPRLGPDPVDIAVIALGVNDTVSLTRPARWAKELGNLIAELRSHVRPALVVVSGVPPMDRFPALPQPLAAMLGLRARLLDALAREVALDRNASFAPAPVEGDRSYFCADGFHPSPVGYESWARHLAAAVPDPPSAA